MFVSPQVDGWAPKEGAGIIFDTMGVDDYDGAGIGWMDGCVFTWSVCLGKEGMKKPPRPQAFPCPLKHFITHFFFFFPSCMYNQLTHRTIHIHTGHATTMHTQAQLLQI